MKKTLLFAMILLASCDKNDPQPTQASPSTVTPTGTNCYVVQLVGAVSNYAYIQLDGVVITTNLKQKFSVCQGSKFKYVDTGNDYYDQQGNKVLDGYIKLTMYVDGVIYDSVDGEVDVNFTYNP